MKVSIIITAWNKQQTLPFVLSSLARQKMPYAYEVLVLNDGLDNDGTKEICQLHSKHLNLRYLFTGKRNTPEKMIRRATVSVINIGVKQAIGDIIIINSAEVYHLENTDIVNLLAIYNVRPGGRGLPILNKKFIGYPAIVKDDNQGIFLQDLKQEGKILHNIDKLPNLKSRYAFFIAMYKEAYVDIGGGDEDLRGSAWDDTDLTNRLILSGRYYTKRDIKVLHLYHKRLAYNSKEGQINWNYNKDLYLKRRTQVIRNIGKDWGKL